MAQVTNFLWSSVLKVLASDTPRPNPINSASHLKNFRNGVPAYQPECLGDIVNAGWGYYKEIQGSGKVIKNFDQLNEIMLKSIEVLEYRRRIA